MLKQQGATLLEGLISIAIFSIGMLGLGALQINMMKSSQETRYRTIASYYAEEIIGIAMVDSPENQKNYTVSDGECSNKDSICASWIKRVKEDLPAASEKNEKTSIEIKDDIMTVTIRWKRENETEVQQYATSTNLKLLGS